MSPVRYWFPLLLLLLTFMTGCHEEQVSSDPSLRLAFSTDTLRFDTVFTTIGSSTRQVMVYNPNRQAVRIEDVSVSTDYFRINLDGENDPARLHDIVLFGGDSLYLFIRATINPQAQNAPVLINDSVVFHLNGHRQNLQLEAYGQDVHIVRTAGRHTQTDTYRFTADRPYLIYDTLTVSGVTVMDAGATLYMHTGASLWFSGTLHAHGTLDKPIRITSDRLDKLFAQVPYQMASGQWDGIYLIHKAGTPAVDDTLNYVEIRNGNIGLYSLCEDAAVRSRLVIANSRIHNQSRYGIVLLNTDATVYNTEVSNCASYCLFLSGGDHLLTHNTIASYFGYPYSNLNIHTTGREDVAAVYVNRFSDSIAPTQIRLFNSIVAGAREQNMMVALQDSGMFTGEIAGNYLMCDTLPFEGCHDNVYGNVNDTVFRNIRYLHGEYQYDDVRLDSLSPARGIGLPQPAQSYPMDRNGIPRTDNIDAGCYQWTEP